MIPLRYNLRNLAVRRSSLLMASIGVGLVVMIVFILFGLAEGLRRTVMLRGEGNTLIILAAGAVSEPSSRIPRDGYDILRTRAEFASNAAGQPLISPELVMGLNVAPGKRKTQFTFIRCVRPIAFDVHRNLRIVSGYRPRAGMSEWVVGTKLAAKYPALATACEIPLRATHLVDCRRILRQRFNALTEAEFYSREAALANELEW